MDSMSEGGDASPSPSPSSSSSSSPTSMALGGLETTTVLTTEDEDDEDDIAFAAEAAANALEGADAVEKMTGDVAPYPGHDLPHHPLLTTIVPPLPTMAHHTMVPPPVLTPPGPCRICGQPDGSSHGVDAAGNANNGGGISNSSNRPMVRFLPGPPISAAVVKAAPGVTTFGQDICLHVFCGKTAGFLPGRSDPELEIMTKAGLKNKHGIGQEVNAALARTRCGIPILTPEQLREQQQQQQQQLQQHQQHQEQQSADGNAKGHDSASAAAAAAFTGVTTTGTGERSAATAAAAASKERQFYLVREFEAHLAAIRNTTISFAHESGTTKSRPAGALMVRQQLQRHRQIPHQHAVHSHMPSGLPSASPNDPLGPASSSSTTAVTNPGTPFHYNVMWPFNPMTAVPSSAAPPDPRLLQQHYAAGPNGEPSLYVHYPYAPQTHPINMNKQQGAYQPQHALPPPPSVNGTSDGAVPQPMSSAAPASGTAAMSYSPIMQRPAPATPGGSPALLPFPAHQPLTGLPVAGPAVAPVAVATATAAATPRRRIRKPEANKAETGKVQKLGQHASPSARIPVATAAAGVVNGKANVAAAASSTSNGTMGSVEYDGDDDVAAAAAVFLDDGKVRCGCGGTYSANDGTPRGVTSWRNHSLTKRHQKWIENVGSNGSAVGGGGGKTTTTEYQGKGEMS